MGEDKAEVGTSSEANEERELFEQYFEAKKQQLGRTLEEVYETRYGQEVLKPLTVDLNNSTYEQFSEMVPLITSLDVASAPLKYVRGNIEQLHRSFSGGTSGKPKEFYWPHQECKVDYPGPFVKLVQESKRPVLIYSNHPSVDYYIATESLRAIRPDIAVDPFEDASEALDSMLKSDTIYFVTEPSNFRAVFYSMNKFIEQDPSLLEKLKGKRLFIDLGSEPISFEELKGWFSRLKEVFGVNPEFALVYGQNDTGLLGLYFYVDGHTEADFKYRVPDRKFVEVLNPEGEAIFNKQGNLVVTTLRNEGTLLPRYVTGDEAKLSMDAQGNIFISEISRKPEDGLLSFWGYKLYAPGIYDLLRRNFDYPFKLEVQFAEDPNGSFKQFNLNLYGEQFSDPTKAEDIQQFIKRALASLNDYIDKGMLELNINTFNQIPKDFLKGWRILPRRTLEPKNEI